MPMLDVFNSEAFEVTSLTDALNNLRFVPGRLGELGVFQASGVTTLTVAVEQKNNVLVLVPPTPRGGPGSSVDKLQRSLLNISVPHFQIDDAIMADEVQGVRAFGSETEVESVQRLIGERNVTHVNSFAATTEHSRVGAMKGVVTYANGDTLDLYTTFGVTQITERNWDLDAASPAEGILRRTCAAVVRQLGEELDGIPFSGVWAECGDNFFDSLLSHAEVRATYSGWTEAQILRDGYVGPNRSTWGQFEFGGIVWENYRGSVGGDAFVGTDTCHIFPTGAPGLFRTYHAPADYMETVNTVGSPMYQKQFAMPNDKGVMLEVQMNQLNICTRPRVLLQGRRTG